MDVWLTIVSVFLSVLVVLADEAVEDGFCVGPDDCEAAVAGATNEAKPSGYLEPLGITVKAHFAMACFWGVEATFGCQPGVVRVRAGYMGGEKESPTYKDLGDHTEAVEVEYDPYVTKYSELLEVFWKYHDYTAEYKTQYMSAIFYSDEEQLDLAEAGRRVREENGENVATKILPAKVFYRAENYHQKYFLRQHEQLVSELLLSEDDFMMSSITSRLLCYIAGPGEEADFLLEAESLGLSERQIDYILEQMKTKQYEGCAP